MDNIINKRKKYLVICLMIIIVALCFSVVCIYDYGGFKDIGEFFFWINRKIKFIMYKLFHF